MLAKSRISTEEEAKAALAERRRLAREQAEREAELERQRIVSTVLANTEQITAALDPEVDSHSLCFLLSYNRAKFISLLLFLCVDLKLRYCCQSI